MIVPRFERVRANAWTGTGTVYGPASCDVRWGVSPPAWQRAIPNVPLAPPPLEDERDWRDPRVGWGLVAPDVPGASSPELARGDDLPASCRDLLASRPGSSILRYVGNGMGDILRRHFADGRPSHDLSVSGAGCGIGDDLIPRYLLIVGSPEAIPWRAQGALNMSRCVGRLDLDEDALANYVAHLIRDWAGCPCDSWAPVNWSTDHGPDDITSLMRERVADALGGRMAEDHDFARMVRISRDGATRDALVEALRRGPGLVITTSHGLTATAGTGASVREDLGSPVDAAHEVLRSAALTGEAVPGGAVWYAHACCSAGSDARSQYADLFPAGHPVGDVLRSVSSAAGSMTAPLPRRLLGADRPVRAFVGHVEPTFDWTLEDPFTGQPVSDALVAAFYYRLYQSGMPVGLALSGVYRQAGAFLAARQVAVDELNLGKVGAAQVATYRKVAAVDRQSVMVLGDPTVTLPLER